MIRQLLRVLYGKGKGHLVERILEVLVISFVFFLHRLIYRRIGTVLRLYEVREEMEKVKRPSIYYNVIYNIKSSYHKHHTCTWQLECKY